METKPRTLMTTELSFLLRHSGRHEKLKEDRKKKRWKK